MLLEAQVGQFLVGKRSKCICGVPDLPSHTPGLALLARLPNGHELGHRLLPTRNDHFLAGSGLFKQAREIGFCLMDRVLHN